MRSTGVAERIMTDENEPGAKANNNPPDFLLFDEGSFFGLEKSSAWKWFERLTLLQQIAIVATVTWIPMAVLAAIQGVAVGPTQPRSFLEDAGIYVRYS